MFKYNNTHIFTGYLKQLLSSVNLPTCKVYTREFARYLNKHGKEDPRVLKSFTSPSVDYPDVYINYLKNNEICSYIWQQDDIGTDKATWYRNINRYYDIDKSSTGITRTLDSSGNSYDNKTHEYLGDYLRFIRDYYNVNLMSMYNCFTNKIYNNIYYKHEVTTSNGTSSRVFNSQDPNYRIYAIPVKLFAEYTVAIDCSQGIEMFCGFYNTSLDLSDKAIDLANRTYLRVNNALFHQPFIYDKLIVDYWSDEADFIYVEGTRRINTNVYTRWDITNREKDLKLFIKVPVSCKSSITILEGDYRTFNDTKYAPTEKAIYCRYEKAPATSWSYDPVLNTIKTTINGEDYVLGTNNTSTSVGPVKTTINSFRTQLIKVTGDNIYELDSETAYKLKYYDDNDIQHYLKAELTTDNRIEVTENSDEGVQIFFEISRNKHYLYYLSNGSKKYLNINSPLIYQRNHSVLNFNTSQDKVNLNNYNFKPISKLQLLEFNTGESYPFADRLVEYLSGSAITSMDEIPDNIKRIQKVMNHNGNYFKIEGLWENKMRNILYDYVVNSGPIEVKDGQLKDRHSGNNPINYGYHSRLGHGSKSSQYDILGYVDKDTEKLYASWKKENNTAKISSSLQNIDIYNGLYDI